MPPAPALPTIGDVARRAGVSTATVSRVVNQPQTVRSELRVKVERTIAQLGYMPHAGARTLKSRRTGTIGAIFPTVDNAIFAKAIDALQRRLAEADHQLLIATSDYDPATEQSQALNLLTRGVDALMLCGCAQLPGLVERLRVRGVPVVHVMSWPPPPRQVCVGFDNAAAMAQVVRYLLDLGHRRIAMLAGITQDNDRAAARVQGVRDAMAAAGLPLPESRIVQRRYGLAPAREGLQRLMEAAAPPTAVVCGNDVLAFGALLEAQRMGLAVPRDLSIVGFDDLELASHVEPALTTVHVPAEAMWRRAAERALDMLAGRTVPRDPPIEVSLVVRGSTAPPRARKRDAAPPAAAPARKRAKPPAR
jgi:LacI family transcriptional regulator